MVWLYRRADFGMVRADGSVGIGLLRWYQDSEPDSLVVRDGRSWRISNLPAHRAR